MDTNERGLAGGQLPVACELSDAGRRSRREDLSSNLFAGCEDVRELADGYEFVFPGEDRWIERLARFVAAERRCCRFFTFELCFEPGLGPVSLRMRGPAGTKEFLAGHFAEGSAGVRPPRTAHP